MVAAFGQLLIKRGEIADAEGRRLRSLFDRPMAADYGLDDEPEPAHASAAVADAEAVVDSVASWLAGRR